MFNRVLSLFAAVALTTSVAALNAQTASSAEGVIGSWTVTVKGTGAHGDLTAALVIARAEQKLTATLNAHGSEQKLTGDFVKGELKLVSGHADEAQRLTITARLSAPDTLSGYLSGPMGDMALSATRTKGDR